MAGYNEIKGLRVKYLSDDPAGAEDGQVWYNSTTGNLRLQGVGVGAWSSGAPTIEVYSYASSSVQGTQTASLIAAGGSTPRSKSESYNGIGFSAEASLINGRGNSECGGGAGTATAALCYNGTPGTGPVLNFIEAYDGTSWSEQNDLSTGRMQTCGAGLQTAALCFSGYLGPPGSSNATEEYNGTSWSGGGALSTARRNGGGNGIQTSALMLGGINDPTVYSNTEEYDGSSWTAGTSYPTNIRGVAVLGSTASDVIAFGGNNPPSAIPAVGARQYNGTTWTAVGDLAISKQNAGGMGTTSTGLAIGGTGSAAIQISEEYNFSSSTITPAAWASGGTVPYTSRQNMSFGTQDAAINVGGYVTATLSTAASYDGASWTASPSLNVAARYGGVAGTQTAGLEFGGIQPPGSYNTNVQTWNGSVWADSPLNLTTGTYGLMGCGTQTAALKVGGENPAGGNYTTSEEFDGEGWTAGGALPEAKYVGAGNGVQTSAIITGGSPSGTTTFEYNGSSWTAGGALATSRPGTQAGSAGSTSDSNIVFGGNAPGGVISATEGYDGTSWSTRPSLATGRGSTTGNGTESAGLMVSGGPPSSTTTLTEEFTGETVTANPASNLSVS